MTGRETEETDDPGAPAEKAEQRDEQLAAKPTDGLALMATDLAQRGSRALPVRELPSGDKGEFSRMLLGRRAIATC